MTRTWFHHHSKIYAQLPMKVTSVLPDEGCGPLLLEVTEDGILMWVHVKPKPSPGVRWGHRVMVICPKCQRVIPFGRMNQHWPTHH